MCNTDGVGRGDWGMSYVYVIYIQQHKRQEGRLKSRSQGKRGKGTMSKRQKEKRLRRAGKKRGCI